MSLAGGSVPIRKVVGVVSRGGAQRGGTVAAGDGPIARTMEIARSAGSASRYLAILVVTLVSTAAAFVGLLTGLDAARLKPPPAFTNSYCVDAKLEFLRRQPPVDPTHLIAGSSIAWRNIDAGLIVERHAHARPLNGGFCGLSINQSLYAADFLLSRFPTITDVLVMVDPFDMGACRSNKTALFDQADVSAYLAGVDDWEFYFKYFDVFSLLANAFGAREPLTRYGDGPLETDAALSLVYEAPPRPQPECLAALARFADAVEKSGRNLVVVTMPLVDAWSDKYDRNSRSRASLAAAIRSALAGTGASFFDAWSATRLPSADYVDAVHLRWSAVPAFTRWLVQTTGFGSYGN